MSKRNQPAAKGASSDGLDKQNEALESVGIELPDPAAESAAENDDVAAEVAMLRAANERANVEIDRLEKLLDAGAAAMNEALAAGQLTEEQAAAVAQAAGLTAVPAGEPRVWEVDIPGGLIGPRYVLAATQSEAIENYKRPCGVTQHAQPAVASLTEFDPEALPEGVTLWG